MQNKTNINNEIYEALGERWYTAFDDPVALLRQESKVKIPWILDRIQNRDGAARKVLDIGCGAGFLSNALAKESFEVFAVDLSEESLNVARNHDQTKTVHYQKANAYDLPYANASFEVVTALDLLEHVEEPERAIQEVSRVLKPGGQFFFHTFNRNRLAHLVIIKLVEWFVRNTPKNMHVIELFISPAELRQMCRANGLEVTEMTGIRPRFSTLTVRGILTRTVPRGFAFKLTKSLKLSYLGVAQKT